MSYRLITVVVLLLLIPAQFVGAADKRAKGKKAEPAGSSAMFVPLSFEQLVTENRTLTGHGSKIRALAYAPDGNRLASGDDDKALILWDVRKGEQLWSIKELPDRVTALSFCSGGELLALSTKGKDLHLVDAVSGAYITGFRAEEDVQSLACATRGRLLAVATQGKGVVVWDLGNLRTPLNAGVEEKKEKTGLFSWGKRTGNRQRQEEQARADRAVVKVLRDGEDAPYAVAFSPNGDYLAAVAAGKGKRIAVWDARQWGLAKNLEGVEKEVRQLAFSPEGRRLAAVEDKRRILVWELHGKANPRVLGSERDDITGMAFSADGSLLVSTTKKRTVIWSTRSFREIHAIPDDKREPLVVQCSPDNAQMATAGEDKAVHLWNVPGIVSLAAAQAARGDDLKTLDQERDERISLLFPQKSEFESSREYQARLKRAKAEEGAIRSEYAAKRKQLAARLEEELARLKERFYPYTAQGELGRYEADLEAFHVSLNGMQAMVRVPARQAKEIAARRENVVFSGLVRYHDPQKAEFLNAALVDQTTGARFPFGRQVGGAEVASVVSAPLPAPSSGRRSLPTLEIATVALVEPSGNSALDAGERGSIRVTLRNNGSGAAEGVAIGLRPEGGGLVPAGLTVADKAFAGTVAPNQTKVIDLEISATDDLPGREVRMQVSALEANGFDAQPVLMAFTLKGLVPPDLQVAKIEIGDAEGKRVIAKGKEANLTLSVTNAGHGAARGVTAGIEVGDPQIKLFGDGEVALGLIKPGETKRAVFTIAVTQRYKGAKTLPVKFRITEERPRFGIRPEIRLALNEEAPETRLVKVKERESAPVAADPDDVGMAPLFAVTRRAFTANDLAVVIGIERYQSIPKSDYAYNDARSVKAYLLSLGFAERNIEFLADERATLSAIRKSVESWLPNRVKQGSRIFFYYSGHGAPDPATGEAFIVPFDGDPSYLNDTGYPIRRLYEKLGAAKAAEVIVVMDSCFSGSGGRSVMAKGARPLVLTAAGPLIPQQMAVLSSTQGAQISTSLPEQEHGVFTYYFLKAIKEGKGDLDAIYRFAKPLVEDAAKGQNVTQSPVLNTGGGSSGRFKLLND
jgi:hypothetical protein